MVKRFRMDSLTLVSRYSVIYPYQEYALPDPHSKTRNFWLLFGDSMDVSRDFVMAMSPRDMPGNSRLSKYH